MIRIRPRNVRTRLTAWYVTVLAVTLLIYCGGTAALVFHELRGELVYVPYITLQIKSLLFPPGLGGSGFDLLHLDPRAIDLFDDVPDGGASR